MADDLSMDLEELQHLKSIAKRPRVLSLISGEIQNIEKQLSKESGPVVPPQVLAPTPLVTAKVSPTAALSYTTLSTFSWDQDNDKVKIYITLEGVQQEKVETSFNPKSVEVKFHDVNGKNFKFAVPKLNKEIVPDACKITVKPTRVMLTLPKASKGNWLDLYYKEDKLKPNLDKEKDPMAGIMDLMKNMYEEGDEDMKRTIAKAWSDARSGKSADPLKGYR